jgi:hypothetical protein
MGEFDGYAAEIVPCPGKDGLDLGIGFFRKSGVQVGASDAVLLEQRTNLAHQPTDEIGRPPAIHPLYCAQRADRENAYDGIVQNFQAMGPHALAISEKSGPRNQNGTA